MNNYVVTLDNKTESKFANFAIQNETTISDIILRAMATYNVLRNELTKDTKISITDKNDNVLKDIIIP